MTKSSWKSVFSCFGSADIVDSSAATRPRTSQSDSDSPKKLSSSDSSKSSDSLSPEDLSLTLAGSNLHAFTLSELKAVTRNFSNSNFIGSGGFGPVFKGYIDEMLRPGLKAQHVAVKSLDLEGTQGHKEWLAEVIFLGQLRHPHLAKLIGYCCEDEHRLLVYEYMARGSLEQHLFKTLPWSTRLKIAVGAAKGLAFLHESEKPVIYRDFKASNILLDADYTAKLSDFGLAKDGPQGDDTHVTTRVMGTHGYAAPEYILTGHLTAKSDVYSFGVVLLELLSGRRSVDKTRPNREKNLVEWARPYLNSPDRLISRVMDPNIDGQYSAKGAQKAAAVAYKCLSQNPKARPSMRTVVETLEPLLELKDVPLGTFAFVVTADKCGADLQDDVGGMKKAEVAAVDDVVDEAEVKEPQGQHHHHHNNHDLRHKKRFPNSAIHSEFTLHRDGKGLYKNSLRSSQKQNRQRGA